jgi:hypothetical protein
LCSPLVLVYDKRKSISLLAIIVLSNFAIKKEEALGFVLVFHALWHVPQTLLGLIVLIKKNLNLWQLLETEK